MHTVYIYIRFYILHIRTLYQKICKIYIQDRMYILNICTVYFTVYTSKYKICSVQFAKWEHEYKILKRLFRFIYIFLSFPESENCTSLYANIYFKSLLYMHIICILYTIVDKSKLHFTIFDKSKIRKSCFQFHKCEDQHKSIFPNQCSKIMSKVTVFSNMFKSVKFSFFLNFSYSLSCLMQDNKQISLSDLP